MPSNSTFRSRFPFTSGCFSFAIDIINFNALWLLLLGFQSSMDTTDLAEMAPNIVWAIALVDGVDTTAGVPFKDHPSESLILILKPDSSTKIQLSRQFISVVLHFKTQVNRSANFVVAGWVVNFLNERLRSTFKELWTVFFFKLKAVKL